MTGYEKALVPAAAGLVVAVVGHATGDQTLAAIGYGMLGGAGLTAGVPNRSK